MKRAISEYSLYRWRYVIGYVIGTVLISGLLVGAMFFVPGGLRAEEMASSVTSSSLNFHVLPPDSIINLPYHALQHLSFSLFGVSIWSIKLVSMLLAVGTIIGLFLLIREWFRPNVAMITTTIIATLPIFLFAAQDGTPLLYEIFVSIWLLVTGTYTSRGHTPRVLWKTLFFILFALNLYAPLGVYLDIALLSTVLFHPHIRHLVRRLSKAKASLGIFLGMILSVPLIYGITQDKHIALTLAGWPEGSVNWLVSLKIFAKMFVDFSGSTFNGITGPILPVGVVLLMCIGIYFFVRFKYTAQSYILSIWALFLVPLCIINLTYMPYLLTLIAVIIATGINGLIRSWYGIFPRNPYARTLALLPLGVIVIGVLSTSLLQYAGSYYYDRATVESFSDDLKLLPKALSSVEASKAKPATLVVTPTKADFYAVVAKYNKSIVVTSQTPPEATPHVILAYDATAAREAYRLRQPTMIITNRLTNDSDRFYTYSSVQK